MFEVVDANLAAFRRTAAPAIDPRSDSWWAQGYNDAHDRRSQQPRFKERFVDGVAALVPSDLKAKLPANLKNWIWTRRSA